MGGRRRPRIGMGLIEMELGEMELTWEVGIEWN